MKPRRGPEKPELFEPEIPDVSLPEIYYKPQIESENREPRLHLISGPPYYLIEQQPLNLVPDIEKLVQSIVSQNTPLLPEVENNVKVLSYGGKNFTLFSTSGWCATF